MKDNKIPKKKIIYEVDQDYIDWLYQKPSLSKIKDDIDELMRNGATHIEISYNEEEYCIDIKSYKSREETDLEFKLRMEQEEYNAYVHKEWELSELKRLQEKYKDEL